MHDESMLFKHGMLLIWPDDATRHMVNHLREQYDPESHRTCEAHITLTQPFLRQPNENDWRLIESVLDRFRPFEIQCGPIETFENSSVLKFDIEPKEKIAELRNALHALGLFNLDLPFTEGFIPHMTISESGMKEHATAVRIAYELNQKIPLCTFHCASIVYARPDTKHHFSVLKSVSL